MLIIAHHRINDTNAFWTAAQNVGAIIPAGVKLHSVFPSADLKSGTCIWEADNVDQVQQLLDDYVGNVSSNFCYEVNKEASMNLPSFSMEAVA